MEQERNALAVLEAIERLTDPKVVETFSRLRGINERYPKDEDILENFPNSQDAADLAVVVNFVAAIAVLSRRRVIDPSLLADAIGISLRRYWETVRVFILRRRRLEQNEYIGENMEWLAMYCAWWKTIPRGTRDKNYDPQQFAGVEFKV